MRGYPYLAVSGSPCAGGKNKKPLTQKLGKGRTAKLGLFVGSALGESLDMRGGDEDIIAVEELYSDAALGLFDVVGSASPDIAVIVAEIDDPNHSTYPRLLRYLMT